MSAPTALPEPTVWRDSEVIYMPHWVEHDNSTMIVNSAGGVYPKPIVEPVAIGVIHGVVHFSSYSDSRFKQELNTTNSGSWRGWDAGQAWISRIVTEEVTINGNTDAVKVHYQIRCNEFGWNHRIPQMGYFHLSGGQRQVFEEGIGLLSSGGGELPVGGTPVDSDIQVKRRINFSTLGF